MDWRINSLMPLQLKTALLWQFYVTSHTKMYVGFSIKNSWQIFVSPQYQISQKFVQWEPCWYMPTDGRTDMTKLIHTFGDYANVPKMVGKAASVCTHFWKVDRFMVLDWWSTLMVVCVCVCVGGGNYQSTIICT